MTAEDKIEQQQIDATADCVAGGRTVQSASFDAIGRSSWAGSYLVIAGLLTIIGLALIASANRQYAPQMYQPGYMATVADALAQGENYAVFDLNINIRELRNEQIKRLPKRPDVVVLGASQWQEAGADLFANRGYFNGHVHRDYYEDMLGMVEMLTRHDKLPRSMIITIRDRLFTPVADRKDFLWLPILPYYRAMAQRLSLHAHAAWETYPFERVRERLSLPMLFENVTRWHNARDWPYPTVTERHDALDLLRPDGSIRWSDTHQAIFTEARARRLALTYAQASRDEPIAVDPDGVAALDTLLSYLEVRGVKVYLAHPPFNPVFWDAIQGSPFMAGLERIESITRELAARHKLGLVGSFDPAQLGCTEDMFIDAEHSQEPCLRRLLADVANTMDLPPIVLPGAVAGGHEGRLMRTRKILMASGWMAGESGAAATAAPETTAADDRAGLSSFARSTQSPSPKALLASTGYPNRPAGDLQKSK